MVIGHPLGVFSAGHDARVKVHLGYPLRHIPDDRGNVPGVHVSALKQPVHPVGKEKSIALQGVDTAPGQYSKRNIIKELGNNPASVVPQCLGKFVSRQPETF